MSIKNIYIDNVHMPMNDYDQSRAPLIVVTEALPSEETNQDPIVKLI